MNISAGIESAGGEWRIPERLRLEFLALLSADPSQPATMSYDDFLAWADEDTLAEWVDGRIVMASPASAHHQRLVTFLHGVLAGYAALYDLGTVIAAPFQMKLSHSGREPDVLFVAHAHLDRLEETRLLGPADLVVEVVSPESQGRDRGDKFYEYQAGGVGEYWLVDITTRRAEFYQRDDTGLFQTVLPGSDGAYHSRKLPGFWLQIAWLWQEPLPSVNQVLLAVSGEAYAAHMRAELADSGL